MKPVRFKSGPMGEQITNAQHVHSSVFEGTPSTWMAGTVETVASTPNAEIGFLSPITLLPQDLYSWPLAVEFNIYGIGEGGTVATAGTIRPQLWAETDLTKELPVFRTSAGTFEYATNKTARQSSVTAANLITHIPSATFTPVAGFRTIWHWNCVVSFFSVQVTNQAYNAPEPYMEWKQMTRSTLWVNPNSGVYDNSVAANNAYTPLTADGANTVRSDALAISRINCTNGVKIAPAISRIGFPTNYRILVCSGIARCIPENNRTPNTLNSSYLSI